MVLCAGLKVRRCNAGQSAEKAYPGGSSSATNANASSRRHACLLGVYEAERRCDRWCAEDHDEDEGEQ